MRIGNFGPVLWIVVGCLAFSAPGCRKHSENVLPGKSTAQPGTVLDELKAIIVPSVAPEIKAWLGEDLSALVSTAEEVDCYHIMPKKKAAQEQIAGYPVLRRGLDVTSEQRIRFQTLLLDQHSYHLESLKKCLFLPEYAFRLYKGDEEVTVLWAPSCAQIKVLAGQNQLLRDCDPALPKFQQFVEELFPESEAVTNVSTPQMEPPRKISATVQNLLGNQVVDILSKPETTAVYRIFPKQQEAETTLLGYPILEQGQQWTQEQVDEFQTTVLADSSYRAESLKKCLFLPEYAIAATRDAANVTLLCDVNCGQVKFIMEEQAVLTDWQEQSMASLRALMENALASPEHVITLP